MQHAGLSTPGMVEHYRLITCKSRRPSISLVTLITLTVDLKEESLVYGLIAKYMLSQYEPWHPRWDLLFLWALSQKYFHGDAVLFACLVLVSWR